MRDTVDWQQTDWRVERMDRQYGLDHQLRKLQEELAELSEAIAVHLRSPTPVSRKEIIGEAADVHFLLRQIGFLLNVDSAGIDEIVDYKYRRQLMREGLYE